MLYFIGQALVCVAVALWVSYIFGWLRSRMPFIVTATIGILALSTTGMFYNLLPALPHFTFKIERPDPSKKSFLTGPTEEFCETMPGVIRDLRLHDDAASPIIAGMFCQDILNYSHDTDKSIIGLEDAISNSSWLSATQKEWNLCAARQAEFFKNNCSFLYTKEHKANQRDRNKWIFSKEYN